MKRTTLRSTGETFVLIAWFTDEIEGRFIDWYEVRVGTRIIAVTADEIYD